MSEHVLSWNPHAACRTIEGTVFVLVHDRMISLNRVGSFVWEKFEKGSTIDNVVRAIVDEFDVSHELASADATTFVRTLKEKGLLVATNQ